jgi:fermentation-respiration switch protein FrsA (DUF1100 family)
MQRWIRATALVTGLGLLVVGGARAAERHFLFRTERAPAVAAPADAVQVEFRASDGAAVMALALEGPAGAPVVVHFHNNSENAAAAMPVARELRARGFGVLLVEYRGYGASEGEPSEQGLYLDAQAALDGLASRGIGPSRVLLWGTSLGTGVAAEMARRGRGAALVLVAPFTSIPALVTSTMPLVPAEALLPDRFDTRSKAGAIRVPTLVVHGDADEIVPFAMGEELARSIEGATLLRVTGGHHADLFDREGPRLLDAMVSLWPPPR